MPILKPSKLFGSTLRTRTLVALALMEESFPSELARVLNSHLFPVQRVVDGLEREGLVSTRKPGLERRATLNPRYFAFRELRALLLRAAEADTQLVEAITKLRTRPRRRGKAI